MTPRRKRPDGERRTPLYQQTTERLTQLLAATPPDAYLPSEPDLAQQLGVSRATLREAMRAFEAEGRIRRRQGVGTIVTRPPMALVAGLEVLESLETLASRTGQSLQMSESEFKIRAAEDEDARALGIEPVDEVMEVSRVMHASGRPVAFLVDVLPRALLPPAIWNNGFTGSVLDLLRREAGVELDVSRTEISAVAAVPEIARRLQIQRGDVLLRLEGRLFSREGTPLDHSWSYFLPGTIQLHVVRRVERSPVPSVNPAR